MNPTGDLHAIALGQDTAGMRCPVILPQICGRSRAKVAT